MNNKRTATATIAVMALILVIGIGVTTSQQKVLGMTDKQRFDQGKYDFVLGERATLQWALDTLSSHPFTQLHSTPYQNGFIADINIKFGTHIPYIDYDKHQVMNVPGLGFQ